MNTEFQSYKPDADNKGEGSTVDLRREEEESVTADVAVGVVALPITINRFLIFSPLASSSRNYTYAYVLIHIIAIIPLVVILMLT